MTAERVSALEAHHEHTARRLKAIEGKLDQVHTDLGEIKTALTRQKGFIAGMMAVIVPLWSLFVAAAITLWRRIVECQTMSSESRA